MGRKFSKPVLSIVLADIHKEPYQDLCQSLANYFEDHGWYILIYNSYSDIITGEQYSSGYTSVCQLINYDITDVLLLFEPTITYQDCIDDIYEKCRMHHVPVIVPEGSRNQEGVYNIHFDYETAFYEIVDHVITKHGCKTINMMAGRKNNYFSDQRIAQYKKALEKNHLAFEEKRIYYGDFWSEPTKVAMKQMLKDYPVLPDAIVCANDAMAITVCEALGDIGKKIPDDIIVTGFDGIEAEQFHSPRLTTASMDTQKIIEAAFSMASSLLENKKTETISVPLKVRFSQSCRCCEHTAISSNKTLIAVYNKISMTTGFTRFANDMTIEMSRAVSDEEMVLNIGSHMHQESHLCVDPTVLYKLSEALPKKFGEKMIHLGYRHGEHDTSVYSGIEFNTKDLLPNLEEYFQITAQVVICSIFRRNDLIGYYCLPAFRQYGNNYEQLDYFMLFLTDGILTCRNTKTLHYLMTHDALTKLYNRRGFYQDFNSFVERANKNHMSYEIAVLSIDLDGLKTVNDTFGHEEGDFLIKSGADIFRKASLCGSNSFCARFGGDEFVIVCFTPASADEVAKSICSQIEESIKAFNLSSNKPYKLATSIGYETAKSLVDMNIDQLLSSSDQNMYTQKKHHKRLRGL